MSFHGPFDAQDEVMSEINMTPLVDVMLVLLVIFMLTVPVLTQAVRLELPKASTVAEQPEPDAVTVSVAADGSIFWNETPVTRDEFRLRLQESAARSPQPMLRIRGDKKNGVRPYRASHGADPAGRDFQDRLCHRSSRIAVNAFCMTMPAITADDSDRLLC